ncbi:bifunctional methylenetetrahydrofolate dehydrogenase/cyclohydrolase, mitochondrial-like [Littorina saxatilis]|uniref:methenyltetrahydrofolate cyclohydrolase n=1 Tax=Littorina saxatilis TaxID=31220 RepID=A0AAN9BUH1_9CAEN
MLQMTSVIFSRRLCVFGCKLLLRKIGEQSSGNVTPFCQGAGRKLHVTARLSAAKLIDGVAIAKQIRDEVKAEVSEITASGKRPPQLTVVLVGSDPASVIYIKNKIKACEYTGITSDTIRLPNSITEKELLTELDLLNNDPNVDGLLVQLPVPDHICERTICDSVAPEKDVDGFNIMNVGSFCVDAESFIPATPAAVMQMIKRTGIETFGKNAVVCGRSKNVGLPIAIFLHGDGDRGNLAGDATTTICHRYTPPEQLQVFTKTADIIVAAAGVPNLITADIVKEGVVVIDVGINRVDHPDNNGKSMLVGDVDFEGVSQKASYISPVPGGVGPCTVAMLMKNTLLAYKKEIHFAAH